ncbi:hypothetical protein P7C71_g4208, partial [Lecanoromycetidae sp. Uapishka_2]
MLQDLNSNLEDGLAIVSGRRNPYEEQLSDSDSTDSTSGGSTPDFPGELKQISEDINEIITFLYELSMTIRNAVPRDRYMRMANMDISQSEEWDIRHVEEKFPQLKESSSFLIRRLGKASSRRRQFFKYLEKDESRSSYNLPPMAQLDTTSVPSGENPGSGPNSTASGLSTTAMSVYESSALTAFIQNQEQTQDSKFDDNSSETSSATLGDVSDKSELQMPPPPSESLDNKPFECPYCYEVLRVPSTLSWR